MCWPARTERNRATKRGFFPKTDKGWGRRGGGGGRRGGGGGGGVEIVSIQEYFHLYGIVTLKPLLSNLWGVSSLASIMLATAQLIRSLYSWI